MLHTGFRDGYLEDNPFPKRILKVEREFRDTNSIEVVKVKHCMLPKVTGQCSGGGNRGSHCLPVSRHCEQAGLTSLHFLRLILLPIRSLSGQRLGENICILAGEASGFNFSHASSPKTASLGLRCRRLLRHHSTLNGPRKMFRLI